MQPCAVNVIGSRGAIVSLTVPAELEGSLWRNHQLRLDIPILIHYLVQAAIFKL